MPLPPSRSAPAVTTPGAAPFWQTTDGETVRLYHGDVVGVLKTLPAKSVHACITSPPYWGLRDYGTGTWTGGDAECDHKRTGVSTEKVKGEGYKDAFRNGAGRSNHVEEPWPMGRCGKCGAVREDAQLGSEKLHDCLGWARGDNCADRDWKTGCFVCRMRVVSRNVGRVLRDDGVLWVNFGDSYSANTGSGFNASQYGDTYRAGGAARRKELAANGIVKPSKTGLQSGNLCGVPWRFALAMQADGWVLRSDIPWIKRSPMPESVTNRPAKALEYVFMFVKSMDYYFDMEAVKPKSRGIWDSAEDFATPIKKSTNLSDADIQRQRTRYTSHETQHPEGERQTRNFRQTDLWFQSTESPHGLTGAGDELVGLDVTSQGYAGAHFATFPEALVRPLILASTSQHGCCADCGAPWERVVEKTAEYAHRLSGRGAAAALNRVPDRKLVSEFLRDAIKKSPYSQTDVASWFPSATGGLTGCVSNWVLGKNIPTADQWAVLKNRLGFGNDVDDEFEYWHKWQKGLWGNKDCKLNRDNLVASGNAKVAPSGVELFDSGAKTVGWKARCSCTDASVIPCTVIDPFVGSGTTPAVAVKLGRRGWGIDLSASYLEKNAVVRVTGALSTPVHGHLIPRRPSVLAGFKKK